MRKLPPPIEKLDWNKDQCGLHLIKPIKLGQFSGYNYIICDMYRISYLLNGFRLSGIKLKKTQQYKRLWTFKKRYTTYSKIDYFNHDKNKYVVCKCKECLIGRKKYPNLDKKEEVLIENK